MKTILKTVAFVVCATGAFAQPVGNPPAVATTPASCPPILNQAWFRGGNNPTNTTANIFGTMWNSPIYTVTDGQTRSVLNGDLTTNIASVNHLINSH